MQRMIQQFAAEYTSKNSSTQDPSQPNSTKNQSLPKASPVTTSPTAATTQNPVLSKLLMADQDSPLDLTVRKSQSEPSEQDGVLDLSTKKSPCAGSTSLSHSPGCSSTHGNGENSTEAIAVDSNNQSKSPLEKFMVKLCTHHQKQFIRVLSDLYTESQPGTENPQPDSGVMDASSCNADCAQLDTKQKEKDAVCLDRKSPSIHLFLDSSGSRSPLHSTEQTLKEFPPETNSVDVRENAFALALNNSPELLATKSNPGNSMDSSTLGYLVASSSSSLNFHHISKSLEGQTTGQEQEANVKMCEEGKDHTQSSALIQSLVPGKVGDENSEESNSSIVSQRNSLRVSSEETWDSGFMGTSPRTADKENALQCSSKTPLYQDSETSEQDSRPKQENHLHSLGRNKMDYHLHPSDKGQFDHSKDGWLATSPIPVVHKTSNGHSRTKMIPTSIKTARKSKRASGLRINDYDNQCDVVYISQPITECYFENQRSVLSSRRTARKSTRGYYFNGDCCELPTVRTLARNLHSQEKASCSTLTLETTVTPNQTLVTSAPKTTAEVQSPREDDSEEPSQKGTSFKEGNQDTLFEKELQEFEVCPMMDKPNLTSSPKSEETTTSSLVWSLQPHFPEDDLPEENSMVSAPIVSGISSKGDPQPIGLLNKKDMSDPHGCHLVPSTESSSDGSSDDIIVSGPCCSPETISREGSPLRSENQSPPVITSPLRSPGNTENDQSTGRDKTEGTEELDIRPLLNESSMFIDYPSEIEVSEALGGAENVEGEDSDISHQLEGEDNDIILHLEEEDSDIKCQLEEEDSDINCQLEESSDIKCQLEESSDIKCQLEEDDSDMKCQLEEEGSDLKCQLEEEGSDLKCHLQEEGSDINYPSEGDICDQSVDLPEGNLDKKKKSKNFPEASDRCLRSQLSDSSADRYLRSQSLDISSACPESKVANNPGVKHSKKEAQSGETIPEELLIDTLQTKILIENPNDESLSEKDVEQAGEVSGVITRQTLKNMLAKEVRGEQGEALHPSDASATASQPLPGERLEIYVQSKLNERSTYESSENVLSDVPEQSKEKLRSLPAQDVEEVVNEVASSDTQCKDDTGAGPSSPLGLSDGGDAVALPPKSTKLASSAYNLRHTHYLDSLDTTKLTSEKEAADRNPMSKEHEPSEDSHPLDEDDVDEVVDDQPKFVEWCAEEENQELIANFNAQYMKIQKGWIQLEKESQSTSRSRNRSDKLKEIWKSKKRSRKCKGSLEVQKFSPVQMLFMTNFKLSNVCKWFLETTETRSLVIVKKLNTRLPGDIPPVKLPLQKYSPSNLYPSSLQAERLKKHLKKFPGATPARNNWKTQKLWAKFRDNPGQVGSEDGDNVSLNTRSEDITQEVKESRNSHPLTNSPTPASTRILRKYSNIRGKLRAQQRLIKNEKRENPLGPTAENKQSCKSACINPLMAPKHALHVDTDGFPIKSTDGSKGRKGKQMSEVLSKAEIQNKRKRPEGSSTQDRKDKGPATKASKEKHTDASTKTSASKKPAAKDKNSQLPKKTSSKENKVKNPRKSSGKSCPSRKEKENTNKKLSQLTTLETMMKAAKQKGSGESSSRPQKATNRKQSSGKSRSRPLTKTPENSAAQRKRKLKAKLDSPHNKRRRLDTK